MTEIHVVLNHRQSNAFMICHCNMGDTCCLLDTEICLTCILETSQLLTQKTHNNCFSLKLEFNSIMSL